MMALDEFLTKQNIKFVDEKSKIKWVKRLRPDHFVSVGSTIFIDESELTNLLKVYLEKKVKLRLKRREQARKNFRKRRKIAKADAKAE